MKEFKRVPRVRTIRGIKVKKCCLSCEHKDLDDVGCRICSMMNILIEPSFCCHAWEMAGYLQNAGRNLGRIKKREYLEYVQQVRQDEKDSIKLGLMTEAGRKPVEVIRKDYEKEHGSIYWEN